MSDVTVVCCWTNERMYRDFVDTVKSQTIPCEIIGIDNRGNKGFTSCAAAYNSVINDIKTKYVVYSHQDILLTDGGAMSKFVGYLGGIGHDDILGVAGVKFDTIGTYCNFKHKSVITGELLPAGRNRVEGGIMECDTVDECFFGGYTEHFRDYPFDEALCDSWHLYAAEACLRTKSNYVQKGGGLNRVYVCGIELLHLSSGSYSVSFYRGFCRLCRHYSENFPFIRTTCDASRTDRLHVMFHFIRKVTRMYLDRVKRRIKSCIVRKS